VKREIAKTQPQLNGNSLCGSRPGGASRLEGDRLFLLLTKRQWRGAIAAGTLTAMILWPYYGHISAWVGAALFIVGVTVVHLRYASRYVIPFPHIALLIAALQYVLAAWISDSYPSSNAMFNIGSRLPEYLPFGTLVLLACAAGWGVGFVGMRVPQRRTVVAARSEFLWALDGLLIFGLFNVLICRLIQGTSFSFLFVLLASLRYVGVLGRMVYHAPGWAWRLTLVMAAEIVASTNTGGFHELLLWVAWSGALWIYLHTPSWRTILVCGATALLLMPSLHAAKWALRDHLWGHTYGLNAKSNSSLGRVSFWLSSLAGNFRDAAAGNLDADATGDMIVRYNQGWIVNCVMQHVPNREPYACGATLKDAFIACLLPRVIYSDKAITGGRLNMQKFAGIQLTEETSMNLGYAGEMYANFGYWGGIIGCGFYCLSLGLLFRAACIRAFASPMWWAIMPFIFFTGLKAEDDIVGVLNWSSKACLLLAGMCLAFPPLRQALFLKPSQSRPKLVN
jgi:hypothetical protein